MFARLQILGYNTYMSSIPKKKKVKLEEEDWIYDPIVIKGVLKAKEEADQILKKGGHLTTMDEFLEK